MECSDPGVVRDEELIAYLSGEPVRPVVAQHIARCQSCSSRIAAYQQLEHDLTGTLFRWDCPPTVMLGEYHLGVLTKNLAAQVTRHLDNCAFCSAEVASLTSFLADDPMLASRTVPATVMPVSGNSHYPVQDMKQVLNHVREQAASGVRRIVATLVPQQPRLAFQRAPQQPLLWPRRYTAEDVSISIRVEQSAEQNDLVQVLGLVTRKETPIETLQGVEMQLRSSSAATYTQAIDGLGNFVFPAVAPGTYEVELHFPDGIVTIDQLPVVLEEQ